jgi:hypothetical protein
MPVKERWRAQKKYREKRDRDQSSNTEGGGAQTVDRSDQLSGVEWTPRRVVAGPGIRPGSPPRSLPVTPRFRSPSPSVKAVTASGALLRPCAVGPNGPTQLACRARFANRRYLVVVVVDRPPPACFVVVVSPLPRASELPVVALGVVFTGKWRETWPFSQCGKPQAVEASSVSRRCYNYPCWPACTLMWYCCSSLFRRCVLLSIVWDV